MSRMLRAQSPAALAAAHWAGAWRHRMGFYSRKLWDRSRTSSREVVTLSSSEAWSCFLLFQGCWNTLCSRPCPQPRGPGSAGSHQKQMKALDHQQSQRQIQELSPLPSPKGSSLPGVHPPKLLELRGWRMEPVLPCLGAPSCRRERLDAEIPAPGAAQEQAGVANAESGHTVSPSKRRSRCFSAWCSNLGKMKPSIMHLSPQCRSQPGADQR